MYNRIKLKRSLLCLILILIVATLLRVYQLDKVPPSLFGDEVDVGYQAYSILKTGQDLYGNSWPTLVHSLSEYRAPLFIYSVIPFIGIFGLNEWGVRLAPAFWGILGILGLYLLTKKLFNERIGLLSAGFLAISPWHIHYSRAGFEVTMLLTFIIFGVYFFLKGLERKYYLIFSATLFALTPYIYSTAVVFMPLLMILLLIIFKQKLKTRLTILTIAFFVIILILAPFGIQTLSGKSGERFSVISIFSNQTLQDKVLLEQKSEQLPFGLQRFFHNKPLAWTNQFSINYLRAFSPEFLFIQGDPNFTHSIHEMGQMYFFETILLGLGLFWILRRGVEGQKEKWFVLGWLLLAPIPASLTYDGGFHGTRDFLMLPPLMILVALGFNNLLVNKKVKYGLVILIIIAIFNFTFFLHRYFINYPTESWRAWQFGYKESMQYVAENSGNYEKILINNTYEPSLIRFLFWTKFNPEKFHQEFSGDKMVKNITDSFDGFRLDKYYFGKISGPFEQIIDSKTLYVASARDDITNPTSLLDKNVKVLDTVYSPTGEPVFYLLTGVK